MNKALEKTKTQPSKPDEKTPPRCSFDMSEEGIVAVTVTGGHGRIRSACGNELVVEGLLDQVTRLGSADNRIDEAAANFTLGFIDAMAPRDPAEALLVTQMAAAHQAMMTMTRRLNRVENIAQQDAAEKALNKLARTYTTQMETLKRYRSKGQQVVRVERVTVEEGGQAIVGNVETGGRGRDET